MVRARQALYGKFKTEIHKMGEFWTGLQLVLSLLAGCCSSRASWRWARSARFWFQSGCFARHAWGSLTEEPRRTQVN